MSAEREALRKIFLERCGWRQADIVPLHADASFRRYFRLRSGARRALLMDAPPPRENARAFITIAEHLRRLKLRAPRIYDYDIGAGLALIEDFGDDTYTRLLAAGASEVKLYSMAVDILCRLHDHPAAADIAVPPYDEIRLLEETLRLLDWRYPACYGRVLEPGAREEYTELWRDVFNRLPETASSLVLRDFHIDNLMQVYDAREKIECGLLDFQDAVTGACAYDLMSLLEDARRDIDPGLVESMKARYFTARPAIDRHAFETWYAVLGAQRHSKIIGLFTRLCVRDGKCHYLAHIPRVTRLLENALRHPVLAPVKSWLNHYFPNRLEPPPDFDPVVVRNIIQNSDRASILSA